MKLLHDEYCVSARAEVSASLLLDEDLPIGPAFRVALVLSGATVSDFDDFDRSTRHRMSAATDI